MSEAGWIRGEPQASDAADAKDGNSWPGSRPEHEQATLRAQGLPLSAEGEGYWSSQSGMEYGYHLYSDETWLYVSDSCDGLVQPLCSVVGTVKYDGKHFLRKGVEERIREGEAGDIQHGSGQPVYERGIYRRFTGKFNKDQHGQPWTGFGQHFR